MGVKCKPLVAAIAALWVILACVVLSRHETLQFYTGGPGARLAGSLVRESGVAAAPSARPTLQRNAGEAAEVAPQPQPQRIFEGKEVIPLTAALLTLAVFTSMVSDPLGLRATQRTRSTLPFFRSLEQFQDTLGKWNPARAKRLQHEQMQSVASVALVAPVVMAVATRKGGPVYSDADSWDNNVEVPGVLTELVIGSVYEGKDATGNYWPLTVTAANPDGTYTCRLVGENVFTEEPVWPQVWAANCRQVKNLSKSPEAAKNTLG